MNWRKLTWWQKKSIVIPLKIERLLDACAMEPFYWLQRHIERRRARFAYAYYPAHWVQPSQHQAGAGYFGGKSPRSI